MSVMTMTMETSGVAFAEGLRHGEELLWDNEYPGRMLAMGRGEGEYAGQLVVAYTFGGRSDGSKNRMAVLEDEAVRLVAPGMTAEEMAEVPDAALVYYHASDTKDGVFVVSNGGQTRPVLDAIIEGASLGEAITGAPTVKGMINKEEVDIHLSRFEPDDPNFTPRITGVIDLRPEAVTPFGLAVVRKFGESDEPICEVYVAEIESIGEGQGWAIQTYNPNNLETPVPSFDRRPYGVNLHGNLDDIAGNVQKAIGERTFAAAVVRSIDIEEQRFRDIAMINTRGQD